MDEDSREGTIGTGKREAGKSRFERVTFDNRLSSGPSRRRRESSSSSSSFAVPVTSSSKRPSRRSPSSKRSPSSSGKSRGNTSGTHTKVDAKAKLERSRQSARECRARKKLRYQYLGDLVNKREKAVMLLHKELESVSIKQCIKSDLMPIFSFQNRELFEQVESGKKPVEALKAILDQPSS